MTIACRQLRVSAQNDGARRAVRCAQGRFVRATLGRCRQVLEKLLLQNHERRLDEQRENEPQEIGKQPVRHEYVKLN